VSTTTHSRIYFLREVPDFGSSVVVKEDRQTIADMWRSAEALLSPTIMVTGANTQRKMNMRLSLIALVSDE
jgi:hypothetical protein